MRMRSKNVCGFVLQTILSVSILAACGPAAPRPETAKTEEEIAEHVKPVDEDEVELEKLEPQGPPLARRDDVVDVIHGVKVPDPYRWLEDEKSEEVQEWVRTMDEFARGQIGEYRGRNNLVERFAELFYVDSFDAPLRRGERYFFGRRHKDKEKKVYYWRMGEKGQDRTLLDPNTMCEEGSLSVLDIFPDYQGRNVAYSVSEHAADEATLYLMDVETGKVSKKDVIEGAKYARPAWTPDGRGFYYTRLPVDPDIPVAERPGHAAVYFHRIGTDASEDEEIYPKTGDARTFLWPELSRDGRFLFVTKARGWSDFTIFWKDLRKGPKAKFRTFAEAPEGEKALYQVYAWRGWIYVRTNEGAPKYRLFRVNPKRPARKHWQEIVPERKDAVLDEFAVMGGHLVLQYLRNASTEVRIANLGGKTVRELELPTIGSISEWKGNPEDDTAYFEFESFVQPKTIFKTSISKGKSSVYFELSLPVDTDSYVVNQVRYPSRDGTIVTMFLVHGKDLKRDGSNPTLLHGYGGFNVSMTPSFRAAFMVWIENGGVVAVPNLRGGGEYGEGWHRAGMLLEKQNTFDDFIAAARYLISEGYTSESRLAIRGGSNGGLLVGAAMAQAPELFRAVSCHVPLLDMVRYHKFGSGRTWIPEYGSAEDPEQFKAILAYSPYHNLKKGVKYPAFIMFSADSDDRVDPMHARKFTAALRYATVGAHPVLFRVETMAGHGGADMAKKRVERHADEMAFLFNELGMKPGPEGSEESEEEETL